MRAQLYHMNKLFLLFGLSLHFLSPGQDVPSRPLSIPVYHPMVINPAIAGSKDFFTMGLTSKLLRNPDNQLINAHYRVAGADGFFSSTGIGAYIFQEQLDRSWNTGIALTGSYHYALDEARVHNLSAGASIKGFFNIPRSTESAAVDTMGTAFNPNLDLGVYYYGPTAFAGLSVTSLFGTRASKIAVESDAYISRQYHFYGGYKFLVSKANAIVIEPSLLVSLTDSTLTEPHKHLAPYLKIYLQNFYIGTYLRSLNMAALFFQYQFPRFYTGVFLEFPRKTYLNDDNIIFELTIGVNLRPGNHSFSQYRHW